LLQLPAHTYMPDTHEATLACARRSRDWRKALEPLEGAYSDETLRAYSADFQRFSDWCRAKRVPYLPATPETVAAYLDDAAQDLKPATLRRRTAAIRKVHRMTRHADPTLAEAVTLALRRAKRSKMARPRQALGLTAEIRDLMLAACPGNLSGLRDQAMIMTGYDTLCRRSELVALRAEDIELRPSGGANILVRRAKNDPDGNGRVAAISAATLVRLQAWLKASGIVEGPIFRPVHGKVVKSRHLHPLVVSRIVKAAARRAGLDSVSVAGFSGHSMRVGCAQDLNRRGLDLLTIMRAGGWRSSNVVARYVENSDLTIWD